MKVEIVFVEQDIIREEQAIIREEQDMIRQPLFKVKEREILQISISCPIREEIGKFARFESEVDLCRENASVQVKIIESGKSSPCRIRLDGRKYVLARKY